MKGRLIAIGDVHGCFTELEQLLARLDPGGSDIILFLGDLVNRGPDSHRVLKLARSLRAASLLGNHELRLLNYYRSGNSDHLRPADYATLGTLTRKDWRFLGQMTLWQHVPEFKTVFVHGGFLPDRPWKKQDAQTVTSIQVVDADGRPRKRGECPGAPHWSELWDGPPFVVYGHTPREEVHATACTLGIDTGCAYGGKLTALVLPGNQIVQVPAAKRYDT